MDNLSRKVKALRKANGWSQSELAQIATLSQSSIHYIESGFRKNPGIMCLQKLAEALNVSLLELTDNNNVNLYKHSSVSDRLNS